MCPFLVHRPCSMLNASLCAFSRVCLLNVDLKIFVHVWSVIGSNPPPPPRRTRLSSSFAPNLTQLRLILPHKSFTNPQAFPHLNVLLEFLTRKCNKFDVSARAGRPVYKKTKIRNLHNHVSLSYRQLGLGPTFKRTKVRLCKVSSFGCHLPN